MAYNILFWNVLYVIVLFNSLETVILFQLCENHFRNTNFNSILQKIFK